MKVSAPTDFKHLVHVGKDLNWKFDPSVPAEQVFETVRLIGRGGFGDVFLILHKPSMTLLAGKIVSHNTITKSIQQTLIRETQILRKVVSPFTTQYYGSVTFNEKPMILLEYCDRGSLRDLIDYRNLCLTEKQAAIIIHDLLLALQMLHTKYKVLHRDIKAANILLNSDGTIRVTDFGISREFSKNTDNTVSSIGTSYWMAPEVITGTPYSFPADIWSVGATAVELAEGAPPYCELEPLRAMVQISTNGFPGFRSPQSLTRNFKDFISHTMCKDPSKRSGINDLLKHPFIAQVESLDRDEVLKPLTSTEIEPDKLAELYNDDSESTRIINQARKTLRSKI